MLNKKVFMKLNYYVGELIQIVHTHARARARVHTQNISLCISSLVGLISTECAQNFISYHFVQSMHLLREIWINNSSE